MKLKMNDPCKVPEKKEERIRQIVREEILSILEELELIEEVDQENDLNFTHKMSKKPDETLN